MTSRRWMAVVSAQVVVLIAMIALKMIMVAVRGYDAQGSEAMAAVFLGMITWWILDIRAVRADRMERRRKNILKRTRK